MYVLELACFCAHPAHVAVLARRNETLLKALRARFPGLRGFRLTGLGDGRWLQLGFWDNRAAAEAAASEMYDLPEMSDWLAQVEEFGEAA